MKKMMIALLLAAGAMMIGVGCEKKPEEGAKAGGGESVGVAECDDYIKKMEACFAKDAATKTAMEPGFKTMRDSWKTAAASGGAAKDALKGSCKTMLDNIAAPCK